ncbi:MAG: hypothetical protein KC583_17100, partial [Myxococcales bacterium]|nr:hypothetical protein [Myxococcales bacterium]
MQIQAIRRPLALLVITAVAVGCADDEQKRPVDREVDAGIPVTDLGVLVDAEPPRPDRGPLDAGRRFDGAPVDIPDAAPGDGTDAVPAPPVVLAVDTRIGSPTTVAGLANRVTCEALDAEGVPVADVITRYEVRPAEGWRVAEGDTQSVVGARAGVYRITCVAPGLGLRDDSPARWDVLAGPPQTVVAVPDREVTVAGESVEVDCLAWDAEGNPVDASAATVQVAPAGGGVEVADRSVRATT